MKTSSHKRECGLVLLMLAAAALFLGICSKCSPLYPMNDWVDVNCFRTIAKSMVDAGKVLYRDIFDHKGPYLYWIYCIGYLISPNSFLGVYLLEILCLGISMYFCRKILKMYLENDRMVMILVVFYAFIVASSRAFAHGGSCEELCLPILTYSLYYFLRLIRADEDQDMGIAPHMIQGLCMGVLFFTKFTILAYHISAYLFLLVLFIRQKRLKSIPGIVGYTTIGFLFSFIPVALYFGVNRAFGDLWTVYFYNNIFAYTDEHAPAERLYKLIRILAEMFYKNKLFTLVCFAGFLRLIRKRESEWLFFIFSTAFTALVIYVGVRRYVYYFLILFPNMAFGLIAIGSCLQKWSRSGNKAVFVLCICLEMCLLGVGSYFISVNTYMLGRKKSDMAQFQFADLIRSVENASLLNYGFLDGGFYFASGVIPQNKYFFKPNIETPEIMQEQDELVERKAVDFVVTKNMRLEKHIDIESKYVCIAKATQPYEGYSYTFRLYAACED